MCDKRQACHAIGPSAKKFKNTCENDASESPTGSSINDNERIHPVAQYQSLFNNTVPTSVNYNGKIPLQPEELLLYSLINVVSSKKLASIKAEEYVNVSKAIYVVFGVRFDCQSIRNYFYRSVNNMTKGLGKYDGYLRWKFYHKSIQKIAANHECMLIDLLEADVFCDATKYDKLRSIIENECLVCLQEAKVSKTLAYKVKNDLVNLIPHKFPKWKLVPNLQDVSVHLFYYDNSPGEIMNYEVIITSDGNYRLLYMGKERVVNVEQCMLPTVIHELNHLKLLMKTLEKLTICPGVPSEKYESILPQAFDVCVFKTTEGQPGAFLECDPINVKKKVIRSNKCCTFLVSEDTNNYCKACCETNHYLRTLKSRSQQSNQSGSKHKRFDYMSKDELVEHSRSTAKKIHSMQVKIKRLEECQENMSTVGYNTDSEFRGLFQDLFDGLNKKVEKNNNKACYWVNCDNNNEFNSHELLMKHIKESHLENFTEYCNVAPIDRHHLCGWLGCGKEFKKKKLLLNHLEDHIGSESDMFFITLLKDQAKALNVPSRQMRWHPSVIKWCLRLYAKSHSMYSDLRDSGFLKLPSGRTLSDYKNYSSSKSGWQTSVFKTMDTTFKDQGFSEIGRFGGLFFDEVKIKEGLLFDPSTWELVGFVDLENDGTNYTIQKSLATHVLQFYSKSVFSKFQFPCGYFLTCGVSAQSLNRVFWQGVGLLQGYGFTTILSCCDGAAENRAFMTMNNINEFVSQTNNPFSGFPLFFISDPPHIIKKLRNNIYNSGRKEISPRYTRYLLLNSKPILWDHIYAVHQRDRARHIYATDLRNAHVHLDSVSKMRVKLAVQTLNMKVKKDMEKHDPAATESTQIFISHCENLWRALNDNSPLFSLNDPRIKDLDNVIKFFDSWRDELSLMFTNKSDIASHFITWQTMFDMKVLFMSLAEPILN